MPEATPEVHSLDPHRAGALPDAVSAVGAADDDGRRGHPDDDLLEAQAREVAERVSGGTSAGIEASPPRTRPTQGGEPLPRAVFSHLQQAFGTDLTSVRIHSGAPAAQVLGAQRARAVTVGEDISVAPRHLDVRTTAGQALLAHEVAHVVQQRRVGRRPQFQHEDEPRPGEEPVYLSTSIRGLHVSSPGRRMPVGENAFEAFMSVILKRIAPSATEAQVDTVVQQLVGDENIELSGKIARSEQIAAGEEFGTITINPGGFERMAAILDSLHVEIALSEDQRRLLRLGVVADRWAAAAVAELKKSFPWYSLELWRTQLDMHTQVLAEAVATDDATPASTAGRSSLLATLRAPLRVLEATRQDLRFTQPLPPGGHNATPDEVQVWGRAAGIWGVLWGANRPEPDRIRALAIQFYWTAPPVYDPAVDDAPARVQFLARLFNWMKRSLPALAPTGDYTQQLLRDPGRFTDLPFPAHLEAIPTPAGDLRIVPAHAEHRYRFAVDFSSLFDAFGQYAYRWDVMRWRGNGGDDRQTISDIERGRIDMSGRQEWQGVSHTEVLQARLDRDVAHARADARRMESVLGPASVALEPAALGLFELRVAATGVRTLVDVLTLERGPGVRERMIQLPGPGLWVIRAAAVPLYNLADEVHRLPSIAYIPVYGKPQGALADQALADAVSAEQSDKQIRAETRRALRDLTGPDSDPSVRQLAQELADDPRLGDDRWAALQATQKDLRDRLDQLDHDIEAESARSPESADLAVLRRQREAVQRQVDQNDDLLTTHARRVRDYPELARAHPLIAQLVTDEGITVPLAMEWVELPAAKAWPSKGTVPAGSTLVVLSDHTHTNARWEQGVGRSVDEAVGKALVSLLESTDGYGRGDLAVQLPSGKSEHRRIEASLGSIASETVDDLTTLVTLAAIAAAPFTEGASLAILIPVGVVSGARAAQRLYTRYDAGTLHWDLQTLQDFVDIATAAVGVGAALRGAKAAMAATRIGRLAAVSFDVAANVTGYVILGIRLERQLRDIELMNISEGEKRSMRMMAIGQSLVAAGMQSAIALVHLGVAGAGRTGAPEATTEGGQVGQTHDTSASTSKATPDETGTAPASHTTTAIETHTPTATGEAPAPTATGEAPTATAPAEALPADADQAPARPSSDVGHTGSRTAPAETEHPSSGTTATVPAESQSSDAPTHQTGTPTPQAAPATPAPARPATIDDLLTPEGTFRPEYPELARAWDKYADGSRTGGQDPLTPREWAIKQRWGAPARRLNALLPRGWRRGQSFRYPGVNPRAVELSVPSPKAGTRLSDGSGRRWTVRHVSPTELVPRMDSAGEQYLSYPDLRPGEVLVLPNGSRVWIDPQTLEIVDVNPVGAAFEPGMRSQTRGEAALHTAGDQSPAHEAAGSQRLHGATSPGLGGDAPYSIAYGPPKLNLVIENSGIERWVRQLRDNAPRGVDYVFTTRTVKGARSNLLSRTYEVGAREGGRYTQIAKFEVTMRGGGLTDADVEMFTPEVNHDAMVKYGTPVLRKQLASRPPGGDLHVDIPEALREPAGGGRTTRDATPSSPLTAPLERAQRARGRLGDLYTRAVGSRPDLAEPLADLDDAIGSAEDRLAQPPFDTTSLAEFEDVVAEIEKLNRIRTRFDKLTLGQLRALTLILNRIAVR